MESVNPSLIDMAKWALDKRAFVPSDQAAQATTSGTPLGGAGGQPPMPPGAAPGMPGMPPGMPQDPSMAGGAPPMPPMDPSAAGGSPMPPADPNAMAQAMPLAASMAPPAQPITPDVIQDIVTKAIQDAMGAQGGGKGGKSTSKPDAGAMASDLHQIKTLMANLYSVLGLPIPADTIMHPQPTNDASAAPAQEKKSVDSNVVESMGKAIKSDRQVKESLSAIRLVANRLSSLQKK